MIPSLYHCGLISFRSDHGHPNNKVPGANMGPIWVLRPQMGPMLAPWTLLSGGLHLPGQLSTMRWRQCTLLRVSTYGDIMISFEAYKRGHLLTVTNHIMRFQIRSWIMYYRLIFVQYIVIRILVWTKYHEKPHWLCSFIPPVSKIHISTVGERTVALKIIARCSITQTPAGQSKVWWWHARKMVVIYFKRI